MFMPIAVQKRSHFLDIVRNTAALAGEQAVNRFDVSWATAIRFGLRLELLKPSIHHRIFHRRNGRTIIYTTQM